VAAAVAHRAADARAARRDERDGLARGRSCGAACSRHRASRTVRLTSRRNATHWRGVRQSGGAAGFDGGRGFDDWRDTGLSRWLHSGATTRGNDARLVSRFAGSRFRRRSFESDGRVGIAELCLARGGTAGSEQQGEEGEQGAHA